MFCSFPKIKITSIQKFLFKRRIEDKEIEKNKLVHKWSLIHTTIPIIFISEMVLSYSFSIVKSYFSSLLLMYRQFINRENLTGLGYINILLDLSSTRNYKMLLCMIDMMEKILGLWNVNSFFLFLI